MTDPTATSSHDAAVLADILFMLWRMDAKLTTLAAGDAR